MNTDLEKVLKLRSWVRIAHHIPGRIRLKYQSGIIGHLAGLHAHNIEKVLAQLPALKSYDVTSSTGSILIGYDATVVNPGDIEALFSEDEGAAQQAYRRIVELSNHLTGESNE